MSIRTRLGVPALGLIVLFAFAATTARAANHVRTVAVPGGGQPMNAKIDAEGAIHLVFDSPHGPQYARSTDDGATFNKPLPLVGPEAHKHGLVYSVWDLAIDAKGRVHVALGTNAWKLKLPKEEWGFFYTSLAPGARAFSPARNINKKPSEGFSLAADGKGNVTACWLSHKLYASVSHDDGETFGAPVELNPAYDPCDCCTTAATYGADGKLALLYREETNNERDMFLILWDQAKNQISRTRVSSTLWKIEACPMSYYSVVPRKDGYTAVWPTDGAIYFAHLDAKGTLLPPTEIKTPGFMGMRSGMTALNSTDGNTLVTWKKNNHLGWQLYDASSRPSGHSGSAASAGNGAAGVVTKNGDFILFR